MTFAEELEVLRSALTKLPAARLELADKYFSPTFVAEAIREYEVRVTCCLALGEKLSHLEQLGVDLLRESAGLLPHQFKSSVDGRRWTEAP